MKQTSRQISLILFVSLSLILFSSMTFAQAGFQVGGGVGYAMPAGDYGGTTQDAYAGSKYGLSDGVNFHAKGRIHLASFRIAAEIGYSSFSNTGESEPNKGKVDLSHNVLSVQLGPEYHLPLPAFPLTPYVGVNLALNSISGETTFNGVASVPSGTHTVQSATRFGMGISGGVLYSINPLMSIDIGLSYNMMNLIGQSWNDAAPAKDQRIDSYTSLNDDKDPITLDGSNHFIGSARSIHAFRISASVLFGL